MKGAYTSPNHNSQQKRGNKSKHTKRSKHASVRHRPGALPLAPKYSFTQHSWEHHMLHCPQATILVRSAQITRQTTHQSSHNQLLLAVQTAVTKYCRSAAPTAASQEATCSLHTIHTPARISNNFTAAGLQQLQRPQGWLHLQRSAYCWTFVGLVGMLRQVLVVPRWR